MHIPDGFIRDPLIWGGCGLISAITLGLALRRTREELSERATLMPAMTGAFLFAAQMFNFPVAGGTSGHLIGSVLACMLLGGWTGMLVTAFVLIVQCLLFQDGGITALGANILNMAIVGGGVGYGIYTLSTRFVQRQTVRLWWLGLAAFISVMISATLAALEIGLSGVVPVGTALTAMGLVHLPIALAEGVITASVVSALHRLRPELLTGYEQRGIPSQVWWSMGAAIVTVALLAVGFASSHPDGLERVAETLGFASHATAPLSAPFPDYQLPSQPNSLSPLTGQAGTEHDSYGMRALVSGVGLVVVSGLLYAFNRLMQNARRRF